MLITNTLFNWPMFQSEATVINNDENYVLEIELPRFKKQDVVIEISDSILSIKAENKNNKYHYSTTLSTNIDVDKITSKLEDGVLQVSLPKVKKLKTSKKINVE